MTTQQFDTTITAAKANSLVIYGERINVKVTPQVVNGVQFVNIRDAQFSDVVKASMYLRLIELNELPEASRFLVA